MAVIVPFRPSCIFVLCIFLFFLFFTFCILGSYSFISAVLLIYGSQFIGLVASGNFEINMMMMMMILDVYLHLHLFRSKIQ